MEQHLFTRLSVGNSEQCRYIGGGYTVLTIDSLLTEDVLKLVAGAATQVLRLTDAKHCCATLVTTHCTMLCFGGSRGTTTTTGIF